MVSFPSSDVDNNNYYVSIAFKTTGIRDIRTNNLVDLLLEFTFISLFIRYLTGSKNSTFWKYFVYDAKLCGDVSYNRFSNSIEAFEISFSNVNKKDVHAIRPAFDRLVQQYLHSHGVM